jgi:signal peptidase I
VLSVAAALLVGVGLATGRWRVLPVLSPSMRPTFDAGAVVVAVRVPGASVQEQDVIVYQAPLQDRRVVAHRVVRVAEGGAYPVVQTKGDANDAPDPWLARLQEPSVWKVRWDVPRLGHPLLLLRRPWLRFGLLLAVIGCGLAAGLREVWSGPGRAAGSAPSGRRRVAGRRQPADAAGVGDVAVVGEQPAADGLDRDAAAANGDDRLRPAPADQGAGQVDGDRVGLRRRL